MLEQCERAADLGFFEIGITEHIDFDPQDMGYKYFDYEKWNEEIEGYQQSGNSHLTIKKGGEVDYQTRFYDRAANFLVGKDFDYILGAVHYVVGFSISDERAIKYLPQWNCQEIYDLYFEEVYNAARSGLFDVIAHLDLIKRYGTQFYGPFDFTRFSEQIERILKIIVEKGIGLEINTSGLTQAPGETYPGFEAIKLYKELGGEIITVGSDAHSPEAIGRNIDKGIELAREAGFEYITLFDKRDPKMMKIV